MKKREQSEFSLSINCISHLLSHSTHAYFTSAIPNVMKTPNKRCLFFANLLGSRSRLFFYEAAIRETRLAGAKIVLHRAGRRRDGELEPRIFFPLTYAKCIRTETCAQIDGRHSNSNDSFANRLLSFRSGFVWKSKEREREREGESIESRNGQIFRRAFETAGWSVPCERKIACTWLRWYCKLQFVYKARLMYVSALLIAKSFANSLSRWSQDPNNDVVDAECFQRAWKKRKYRGSAIVFGSLQSLKPISNIEGFNIHLVCNSLRFDTFWRKLQSSFGSSICTIFYEILSDCIT